MKKTVWIILLVGFLGGLGPRNAAAENTFETVFKDGFYGGLAGALVGGAALAFRDNPGDHLDYISIGAAVGVFVGVTYGLVSESRALAEIENGKAVFRLPVPDIRVSSFGPGPRERETRLDLLSFRF